jgi:3-methyladenine DNA glycosylase AlkC
MKSQLGKQAIGHIAGCLTELNSDFAKTSFNTQALLGLDKLELKQRVKHIIEVLHDFLPADFSQSTAILKQLPAVWRQLDPDKQISSFAAWPVIDYASIYGLAYPDIALDLLSTLTPLFSAEFAIRPFIVEHPEYCHSQFKRWVNHEDEHVRRLVSEGTRPRLPWGMQLKMYIQDPSPNIPLLSALKDDPSLYVRRSVANHLNDVSKDNPDILLKICQTWQPNASQEVLWIIKHATRSLVKTGHKEVLSLLGYEQKIDLDVGTLHLTPSQLKLGENITFQFTLRSTSSSQQKLVIDFAIHFVKANGQQKRKVFKLKSVILNAGQQITVQKCHAIKPITTRQYYAGTHLLEILVNGQSMGEKEFELSV